MKYQKKINTVLILTIIFSLTAPIFATEVPEKGRFPAGFWDHSHKLNQNGDPGWVKRISLRKEELSKRTNNKTTIIPAPDNFILPVLLGQYSDTQGDYSVNDFQDHLFGSNPTGSMTDYYNEVSYSQFNLTGVVYGWFTTDFDMSYYAGTTNGKGGDFPNNRRGFAAHIIEKADATVDYSLYDNDGLDGIPNSGDDDGYADAIGIVFQGVGANSHPGNDNLWPSKGSLGSNEYTSNDVSANGGNILVNSYFLCPEKAGENYSYQIRQIGTYVHEFGHVLGLPDLYDRTDASEGPDFDDSEGLGKWCLMAGGSWGGDSKHPETPAHMSAWCKIQLGWIQPIVLTTDQTINIKNQETNSEAYLIWEDQHKLSRYFLIENRQKVGFDRYLRGDGLLIYHVDENRRWGSYRYSKGYCNDDETHKLVDLEEADGNADLDNNINSSDAGDPYPGSSGKQTFSNMSLPNSKDYNNVATGIEINNISGSASTMTADIVVRKDYGSSIMYDELGMISRYGSAEAKDAWGGVHFKASKDGFLNSVDVGFSKPPYDYELMVYESFDGNAPGTLLGKIAGSIELVSGHVEEAGWQTIKFNDIIPIAENQEFFTALKILNKTYARPVDDMGVSSGRSYYSYDGITYTSSKHDTNLRARIGVNHQVGTKTEPSHAMRYFLEENYPNPFNPSTVIAYKIPNEANVNIKIFDLMGKEIITLIDDHQPMGLHKLIWNGKDKLGQLVSGGVYFYKIKSGDFIQTNKMVFLK